MNTITRISLLLITFISLQSFGQTPEFERLRSDILEATSEKSQLEGLINYGITISRYSADSVQFYSDSISSSEFENQALAEAGKVFFQALQFYTNNQLDSAVGYFELAEAQLAILDVPNLHYRCRNFLGINYTRLREHEQAAELFLETIKLVEESGHESSHAKAAHANLINVYRRINDFASAIYHTDRLIEYSDEGEMNRGTAFALMNMGQMLSDLKYYERAIDSYNLIDFNYLTGSMPVAVLKNKAFSFYKLNSYDSALSNYEKAFSYFGPGINPDLELGGRIVVAEIYLAQKQTNEAWTNLERADQLIEERTPTAALVQLANVKMDYFTKIGESNKAIEIGIEVESMLNEMGRLNLSQNTFLKLSELYKNKGQTELALKYSQLYNDLNIATRDLERNKRIEQARLKLTSLEASREIEEAEESALFYQRISLQQLAITIISIVLAILIFRFYKKERSEKGLKEVEVEQLNSQLEELNKKQQSPSNQFITLKSKAVLSTDKILYIQSDGPYLEFFLTNKERPEVDRNTLKSLLTELPPDHFIQVHRSYIVNINFIKSIYSNRLILKNDVELNISRSFKEKVESALKISA